MLRAEEVAAAAVVPTAAEEIGQTGRMTVARTGIEAAVAAGGMSEEDVAVTAAEATVVVGAMTAVVGGGEADTDPSFHVLRGCLAQRAFEDLLGDFRCLSVESVARACRACHGAVSAVQVLWLAVSVCNISLST